jgi:hypothetical protein
MLGLLRHSTELSIDITEGFIERNKAMTRMDEGCINNASRAVVPIRTVEALVTNTVNVLIASIANSVVSNIASRFEKSLGKWLQWGILDHWNKSMAGVVTMLESHVAHSAEVEVLAAGAGDKVIICKI